MTKDYSPMYDNVNRLNIGHKNSRARLGLGSALSGSLALMLLAIPGAASAADECGVAPVTPGTVTCTVANNPYATGVTYVAPPADLTIVLEDGVRIDTTGTLINGLTAVGDVALTVNGGTNTIITTDGVGSYGALVANNVDPLSVTLDQINTSGANATGVFASSSEGAVAVTTNSITTLGAGADGIFVSTGLSPITIDSGTIATSGVDATAIDAISDSGNIDITSTAITTTGASSGVLGAGSLGILAQTGGAGTATINSGSINTSGADAMGISATTDTGALMVTSGPIGTLGANADAINVLSAGGVATVNAGAITTTGAGADGIVATGLNGANVTFTTISTTGVNANGVLIPAGVAIVGPPASATATVTGGSVSTVGASSDGIHAVAGTGAATVNVLGNISTLGDASRGIYASGPAAVTVTNGGTITTAGLASTGVVASSTAGPVTVSTNDITTAGIGADGINASTDVGPITITSDTIATSGVDATAIEALSNTGNIGITSTAITTTGASSGVLGAGSLGILAQTGGAGTITVNSGSINTSGADAIGISATNDTGALLVTSGPIGTLGANADAINVLSAGGVATVNAGAITTTGAGADGIVATGLNGANVTFTTISTTGVNANGVLIPAGVAITGPLASATATVTGGSVSTVGANSDGVHAVAGTGAAIVNVSGNISTLGDNSRGIVALGTTGATVTNGGTITTAGLTSNGVDVASATGPVVVTVRNVTTTGNGSQAVLVNADTGNATVTVNGALRTTGTTANALTVNSGANAVVNVASGATFSTVQGDYIRLNSVGTSTLNNAATIGNNLGGFALVATGGPVTVNNTGNLSSDIVLTAGADRINNSGTFTVGANPDFGAGVDTFNNTGLVTLMAGATAAVSPVFTGLEAFTNSGTIDLRNARAGDTLTLPGTYVGAGGTLGLDITSNGTTTTNDQLIVGGAATGTTTIALNQLAGSLPVFNAGTVLINAGVGSSATAFGLADGGLDAGFVRYEVGFDAPNNNFLLTAAPSDTAFRTLNYAEGIRSLWLKSADAVSAQLRARRDTMWSLGGGDTTGRFWMQIHGSEETREGQRDFNAFGQSRLTNTGYQQDYYGGQIGLDISGSSGDRGGFAFGVTGGYIDSSLNFAGSADRINFDVVNAGVYASYSSGNLFFNALGKYDHYWAKSTALSGGFQQDFSGNIYGARAEMGLRFGSDSFFIEPAASISYVKNDTDDLAPLGTSIAFDEDDGLRGRIGGRIGGQIDMGGPKMSLYAGANYVHEFKGRDNVTFTSGGQTLTYTNDRLRDYGEATVGMTIAQNESVSGFLEANYIRSFSENNGQRGIDGVGGRAGIRFKF